MSPLEERLLSRLETPSEVEEFQRSVMNWQNKNGSNKFSLMVVLVAQLYI